MTLPAPPPGVAECGRKRFPDIADRDLTAGEAYQLIARAKILDREKARCSARTQAWIDAVQRDFAKP